MNVRVHSNYYGSCFRHGCGNLLTYRAFSISRSLSRFNRIAIAPSAFERTARSRTRKNIMVPLLSEGATDVEQIGNTRAIDALYATSLAVQRQKEAAALKQDRRE
jgi:hypothetical protein